MSVSFDFKTSQSLGIKVAEECLASKPLKAYVNMKFALELKDSHYRLN